MGWRISDGHIDTMGRHITHALPAHDWRTIRRIFDRRTGDPFTMPPHEAAEAAAILRQAGESRRVPAGWARDIRALAASAHLAATTNRPWKWS